MKILALRVRRGRGSLFSKAEMKQNLKSLVFGDASVSAFEAGRTLTFSSQAQKINDLFWGGKEDR